MSINSLYLLAISLAVIVFAIIYKDKDIGPKYISTLKKYIMIIVITAISFILNPSIGLIIGFTSAYTGLTNFDKDFSGRFILESSKIIIMQLLVGVAAFLCSFNQILTVITSFIVIFIMYYLFTHKGKASRVRGFLLTYIIILNEKVPRTDFKSVFEVLFLAILLSLAFYYFFTRDSYYKDSKIFTLSSPKNFFKEFNLFVDADTDPEFKKNKFRHAIISTILMTIAIYYMLYFGNPESEWIIIVASAILVLDPVMSEKMIIDRTLGTIIGAIIFLVIHRFIDYQPLTNIFIFISIFYFIFPMAYYKRMVFITYFVLEIHLMTSHYTVQYLVNYRIGFTIIAGIIVSIILALDNRFKKFLERKKQ